MDEQLFGVFLFSEAPPDRFGALYVSGDQMVSASPIFVSPIVGSTVSRPPQRASSDSRS